MMNADEIRSLIRNSGLKVTPQRIAVYEAMCGLGHASADMILSKVGEKHPSLTVATVYNILESFEKQGILSRLSGPDTKMYFDIATHPHCHLYCQESGTYIDYRDRELERILEEYLSRKKIRGFEITGIDLNLKGRILPGSEQ